jgi:ABC-2 type transport system permease protein
LIGLVRILGGAAYLSLYEFFALYPPLAYVIAWLPRVIFQTLFFALVAEFVGGRDLLLFSLVGNAAYITLQATLTFTTASVTWELFAGTVPLIVASPTSPILVFTGRNAAMAANGLISGLLTLVVGAFFGLPLTAVTALGALGILALLEFSSYGLGVFLGSVVLRFPGYRNMTSSLVGFSLLAIAGVNVPIGALPLQVQDVARALPLANGLLALRAFLAGADGSVVVPLLAAEVALGIGYLALATLSFRIFLDNARRRGALDQQ